MSTHTPAPLAGQLRLFQILSLVLLAIVIAGVGFYAYQSHRGEPVTIMLDGKPIATVRNAVAANEILKAAEQQKVGAAFAGNDPVRLQKVQLQRVPGSAPLDTDAAAQSRLADALKLHVHAFVITVNSKASLGLPSSEIATDTLQAVKEHFARMPPAAEIVGEPKFAEKVVIQRMAVDPSRTRATAAEAAPYFWTPPPSRTYTIKQGDRGVTIARRNHISLADLIAVNPDLNLNKLHIGDTVNVQKMPLLLTVQTQKKITVEEPIVANVPASQGGLRRTTYLVTYTDGQETFRRPLAMTTLQKPRTRTSL